MENNELTEKEVKMAIKNIRDGVRSQEIMKRTFHISYRGNYGTGFTINFNKKEYLITARHVVQNMIVGDSDYLHYAKTGTWERQEVRLLHVVEPIMPGGDLAIMEGFDLSKSTPSLDCEIAGWSVGDEVYFFGFPHGMGIEIPTEDNQLALVKTGTISGYNHDGKKVPRDIYIDALANPGFSGGPLVCRDYKGDGKLKITGVVKHFKSESVGGNPFPTNSGIMFASSLYFVDKYLDTTL